MKKFSLFLSAMLISMMSFAAEQTATLSFANKAQRTVFTTSQQVWEQNGLVLTNDKASSSSNVADYANPARFYKGSKLTLKCTLGNVKQIVFDCNSGSYATSLGKSIGAGATVSSDKVTVVLDGTTDTYTIATLSDGQVRMDALTVTYEEATSNPDAVKYTVTANVNDPAMGTVDGAGEYEEGKTATLTANANAGYKFVNWSNGSTENPLKITVTENVEITANFEAIPPMTCAEAAAAPSGTSVVLNPFDVVAVVKGAGYIYIKDESGVNLIYDYDLDDKLKAGDHVEGFVGVSSPYSGLPELKPSVTFADLTVTPGIAPEPTVFTEAPVKADVNKYVKFEGVSLSANVSFTTASATNATMVVNGTNVTLRNSFKLAATLSKDKTYDVVGFVAIYNSSIQVYFLSATEVVAPVEETIYFVNNKNWSTVNTYVWNAAGNNSWPGVAATKTDEQVGGYDVYSFTAESGTWVNVIFNDGSSKTPDLVWTAGKYYWVGVGTGFTGGTKEEAEAAVAQPVADSWTVVGAAGILGSGWDLNATNNDMALQADGSYKLVKENITLSAGDYEYKAAKNRSWDVAVPQSGNQTLKITKDGIYTITFTLNAELTTLTAEAELIQSLVVIPTVVLAGDMNGWNDSEPLFVMAEDEKTASTTMTLEAGEYGFKMVIGGNWLSDAKTITRDAATHTFTGANGENSTLVADVAGEYTFTWTYETKTLVVTYPEVPTFDLELPVEIANLTTSEMVVEGKTYLQLNGSNDMEGVEVMLFIPDYTGEDKEYALDVNSYWLTLGGTELLLTEGALTQTTDEEKGKVFAGRVVATAEEDGQTVTVALDLNMYSTPAFEIEIEEAVVTVDEATGVLQLVSTYEADGVVYPLSVRLAGFDAAEAFKEYEGAQIAELQIGGDLDTDPWLDWAVADVAAVIIEDGVVMLEAEFTSFATGAVYYVMISGTLPVKEEPVVEPTYTENALNTYAFGLESVLSDDVLTVTYRLNNSNATSVNVLVYNGEEVVATVAGTTTIGKNTVEVATATLPRGVQLTWGVEVNGTSVEVPTQETKIYSFYHPSGLDIDNNPENPTFGMLLINEGMQSVASKTEGYVSAGFGAGIFAFTPSFDLMPNGDQPGYNGGNAFNELIPEEFLSSTGNRITAYVPRRVRISDDGRIFVTSLDVNGTYLWELNPANLDEWTSVFKADSINPAKELIAADSSFMAGPNCGFDVKGAGEDLQLMMYSVNTNGITAAAMGGFKCAEYNLGTATEWTTAPSKIWVDGKYAINYNGTQVLYDNEGGIWIASYRGTASDANPGLVHINAEGVEDAKLLWNNMRNAGIRFNNDFTKLVVTSNNGTAKKATIYAVSKDESGAPVLTEETVIDMAVVGNNLNDFAFDYAGNLYACGNSSEKLAAWAMPYSGQVVTPAASKYGFKLASKPTVVTEMVGVVKRALQNGENTIVLTHEADGTAHIYAVAEGTITELVQDGVIARDPENAGDLLAISDIALTEDGKLVAVNYMICQSGDEYVDEGYKRGENRFYIWNALDEAPSVWFTSDKYSNWYRSKQGYTMALRGTSQNAEIVLTGLHATKYWARYTCYKVVDGAYAEDYWFEGTLAGTLDENNCGSAYELNASPLNAANWIMDGDLSDPIEYLDAEANAGKMDFYPELVSLSVDLGKKFNGATYVTVGEQVLMVAPYATAEGLLAGVKVLDITAGLATATEFAVVDLAAAVEATAAATAVKVVEGGLVINLVADATLHTLAWYESIDMVGVVKRAVTVGDYTVVLTHEENGAAHLYKVINGFAIAELSQEGVVPVDPENKGSYLAISDIAVTEDGKLVANNYVRCQFAGTAPEDGYKLGTSYYYIWDGLASAPTVWFTSQTTARSSHGDVGRTFAVKGTSTNAKVLVTAVHNNNRAVRMSLHSIIDGVYEEPNIAGGTYNNDYYFNFGLHTTANYYKEATQGKEFYLLASPLADASWIIEGELSEPSEFLVPAEVGADYAANQEIAAGTLGNKYQGTSIVTVGEQHLLVAPYATAEGLLAGVKVLDITAGLDAATEVATAYLDSDVEATAAATAVQVVEGGLVVTLVADATIYTLNVELSSGPVYMEIEEEVTDLIIDLDYMTLSGTGNNFGTEIYLTLGQDNADGTFTLDPENSFVTINGWDATFIEGYAYDIDINANTAKALTKVELNGEYFAITFNMSSTPAEALDIVITDAVVTVDTIPMFGDMVEYALNMTANWTNPADGVTYPVLVEIPVYYPESTEPSEIMSTVTVGGMGDADPWLGFGEGTLTVTTEGRVVTVQGTVTNQWAGFAANITISGTLPTIGSSVGDVQVEVQTVKMIKNGMLIINRDGKEYNAQGAVIK